ncbi:MAG: endonuclease/exonuclease/phosphatase family protein [Candidatus Kapabacteria bacterium]|nr:endonuclease/exonuclease/phosphatase family protein [Candidatus Kapabacteria bacterium]
MKKINTKNYYIKVRSAIAVVITVFFIVSCQKKVPPLNSDFVIIGTFNVEWLGDGVNDRKKRTEEDYRNIAELIKKTGADILGLEEIENANALNKILKYLPEFSFYIGTEGGAQKIALLYRKGIEVKELGEYMPLQTQFKRTRPGLQFRIKKGSFDWEMMVVHFKSSSHFDDTKEKIEASIDLRSEQAQVLANWIDSTLAHGKEKDLIIVGDFNDSPDRQKNATLTALLADKNIEFLTYNLRSCKNHSWHSIDHIIVTNSVKKRLMPMAVSMFDVNSYLGEHSAGQISDHCPVLVKLENTSPDND